MSPKLTVLSRPSQSRTRQHVSRIRDVSCLAITRGVRKADLAQGPTLSGASPRGRSCLNQASDLADQDGDARPSRRRTDRAAPRPRPASGRDRRASRRSGGRLCARSGEVPHPRRWRRRSLERSRSQRPRTGARPEPSNARTRPSAEATIAERTEPYHATSLPREAATSRQSCRAGRARRACCIRRASVSQTTPGGEPSGASISRGGSDGSNVASTIGSPAGSKTMSWPSLVVTAAKPSGPIARSSTGLRSSCFQTQRPEGVDPADPVALLDQGQAERIGPDRQVGELDQADVQTPLGVPPQVVEDDLAVGRRRQPARRRPEDPARRPSCRGPGRASGPSSCKAGAGAGW